MSIDGTDFRIPQQGKACKGNPFASHKYAGKSALRYKLGIDILEGNLVLIQGPYPAGKFNDIAIFSKGNESRRTMAMSDMGIKSSVQRTLPIRLRI